MIERPRFVSDTNILVSRFLSNTSVASQALRFGYRQFDLLSSEETLNELGDVLARPKFDRFASHAERQRFVRLIRRVSEIVKSIPPVEACRDPKDDKFLSWHWPGKRRSCSREMKISSPYTRFAESIS